MKKTVRVDARTLFDARRATGARTNTEAVRLALEAVIRAAASERLRALRGSEPDATGTPRRREPPSRPRSRAST